MLPLKRKPVSKDEIERKRSQKPPRVLKPKEGVLASFCSTLTGAGKKLATSALNIPSANLNQHQSVEPNVEDKEKIDSSENSETKKNSEAEETTRSCSDGLNDDNRPKSSPEMAVNGS